MRSEICTSVNDKDKRFACLYGILLFSHSILDDYICFKTESFAVADLFERLIRSVFKEYVHLKKSENTRKNGLLMFTYEINGTEQVGQVLEKYKITPGKREINSEIISTSSLGVFTAGVFLSCGSVNDPSKEYHLEFSVPEKNLANNLMLLLKDINVTAKSVIRRGQNIVYVKESESIEDILTFIGAQGCTIELMNVKIFKSVRNKANRIANCDSANIDKVVNAALRQIEDIRLIESTIGFEQLSDELREVAELRLENSEMSLQEIGEMLSVPISRSGVNHRFKKLSKIANEIRFGGKPNEK